MILTAQMEIDNQPFKKFSFAKFSAFEMNNSTGSQLILLLIILPLLLSGFRVNYFN